MEMLADEDSFNVQTDPTHVTQTSHTKYTLLVYRYMKEMV